MTNKIIVIVLTLSLFWDFATSYYKKSYTPHWGGLRFRRYRMISSKSKWKFSKLVSLPRLEASIPSISEFKEFLNSLDHKSDILQPILRDVGVDNTYFKQKLSSKTFGIAIKDDNQLYKLLCSIINDYNSDVNYLKSQFVRLCGGLSGVVTFKQLCKWEPFAQVEDMKTLFENVTGDLNSPMIFTQFIDMNTKLNQLYSTGSMTSKQNQEALPDSHETSLSLSQAISKIQEMDEVGDASNIFNNKDAYLSSLSTIDVWGAHFDPSLILKKEFITYLQEFFYNNTYNNDDRTIGQDGLSFRSYMAWDDLKVTLEKEKVSSNCLYDIWTQALAHERKLSDGIENGRTDCEEENHSNSEIDSSNAALSFEVVEKTPIRRCDTFILMNARLSIIMHDVRMLLRGVGVG